MNPYSIHVFLYLLIDDIIVHTAVKNTRDGSNFDPTTHGIKFEKLPILLHLGSTEAIKNFLVNFDGIGFVSEQSIEKELLLKTLKQIFITNLSIKRFFRIALPLGPELNVPKQFVRFILANNNRL